MVETTTESQNGNVSKEEANTSNVQEDSHDPHFEPVVSLPLQETVTLEENEDELFKIRAKLYRWASECDPAEWKERGTGDVKFLQHKDTKRVRLLMRRDKTLKVCANHFLDDYMKLSPNCGSDRAWVWNVAADFSDEEVRSELLAIKFLNSENANKFKTQFYKSIEINKNLPKSSAKESNDEEKDDKQEGDVDAATESLGTMKIQEKTQNNNSTAEKSQKNGEASKSLSKESQTKTETATESHQNGEEVSAK